MFKSIKTIVSILLFVAVSNLAFATDKVNINTADAKAISTQLQGIGLVKAKAIVDYRTANGPFKSVDQLVKVKGIGPQTVESNRSLIVFK